MILLPVYFSFRDVIMSFHLVDLFCECTFWFFVHRVAKPIDDGVLLRRVNKKCTDLDKSCSFRREILSSR